MSSSSSSSSRFVFPLSSLRCGLLSPYGDPISATVIRLLLTRADLHAKPTTIIDACGGVAFSLPLLLTPT